MIPAVEATCTNHGLTEGRSCSVCGMTLAVQETVMATGHKNEKQEGKDATCTTTGWTPAQRCTVCGEITQAANEIPALGHNTVVVPATAATCTTTGLTEYTYCSRCGWEKSAKEVTSALGHSYTSTVTVNATCSQNGTRKYTCSRCSSSYTESIVLTEYTAGEVYNLAKKSLAEIAVYDKNEKALGLGTGFVFSSDGQIVTNYHVIHGASFATVTIGSTVYNTVTVVAYDKELDLAILKINANNLQAATLCTQEHAVGKTVFAVGSSKGLTGTFTQGIITYANRNVDGVSCVQHDAAISGGNSGGPLFNSYGEVIGINSWTLTDSQNLNFAISVRELSKLSYTNAKTLQTVAAAECSAFEILKNELISNGTRDSSDGDYSLFLGTTVSDTDELIRVAYYSPEYDDISIYLFCEKQGITAYTTCIIFTEENTSCLWYYYDFFENEMSGTLNPGDFFLTEKLQVEVNSSVHADLSDAVYDLAQIMVTIIFEAMDDDLAFLGITSLDLGFAGF